MQTCKRFAIVVIEQNSHVAFSIPMNYSIWINYIAQQRFYDIKAFEFVNSCFNQIFFACFFCTFFAIEIVN